MKLNGSKDHCPPSGVLLSALVSALWLNLPAVGGRAAAQVLRSRNTRRYFAGEDAKEHTRRDACRWVVEAADHAGLLRGFDLSYRTSGPPSCPNAFLAEVIFNWLTVWDSVYVNTAESHSRMLSDYAGFALGRQAVLDLGLRAGALIHLCGVELGSFVALFPGEAPLRSLLTCLQDPDLAKRPLEGRDYEWLDPETGEPKRPEWETEDPPPYVAKELVAPQNLDAALERDTTTIAKWERNLHRPSPKSVMQIARHFAKSDEEAASLLRWLRVQLALIDIGRRLARVMGEACSRQLLAAFCGVAYFPRDMCPRGPVQQQDFLRLQVEALERGADSQSGRSALFLFELALPLMQLPPAPLPPDPWLADVRAARCGQVRQRLNEALAAIAPV